MDLNGIPGRAAEIQFGILIVKGHVALRIEPDDTGKDIGSAEGVIDQIVIGRVFVDAAAKGTVNTRLAR